MSSRPAPIDQGHVNTLINHALSGLNSSAPVSTQQRPLRKQNKNKQATPCKFFATKHGEFQPVFTYVSLLAVSPAPRLVAWPGSHLLLHETTPLHSASPCRLGQSTNLKEIGTKARVISITRRPTQLLSLIDQTESQVSLESLWTNTA
jgi:hypothetical protein